MDAWLKEAEEASQWVEDLERRLHHCLNLGQSTSVGVTLLDSARSKLLQLGVKLDRLESLLRNPPPKPILGTEVASKCFISLPEFREHMKIWISVGKCFLISNKELELWLALFMHYHAPTVFALLLLFRPGNVAATGSKEHNVSTDCCDQDLLKTSYSQGQSELLKPLLQSDDTSRSQVQIQPFSFMSRILLWKACCTIFLVLGLAALLFLLVLLCTAIF